jgi:hypothetical protein
MFYVFPGLKAWAFKKKPRKLGLMRKSFFDIFVKSFL